MKRKKFLTALGIAPFTLCWSSMLSYKLPQPETLYFKDDGLIPNSRFPVLLYHDTIPQGIAHADRWLLNHFSANNWTNAWINGIYSFHHYHSTSHEVLGIFSGSALLHIGGEEGEQMAVVQGDIIVIPAGVGHKRISGRHLGVVGAYPDGRDWDLLRGEAGERPRADQNIQALPIPATDPFMGPDGGLTTIWRP